MVKIFMLIVTCIEHVNNMNHQDFQEEFCSQAKGRTMKRWNNLWRQKVWYCFSLYMKEEEDQE
jgi:hypothetical protein